MFSNERAVFSAKKLLVPDPELNLDLVPDFYALMDPDPTLVWIRFVTFN
jgi:hypothetical protein